MHIEICLKLTEGHETILEKDIVSLDKGIDYLEDIGLTLDESKSLLTRLQEAIVTAQASLWCERYSFCGLCCKLDRRI